MHSILMMAVLSGTSTAPGQYVYFGPCGSVYATPLVAYYPVERAAGGADASGSGRKAVQQKLEDLAAMIERISRGLEKAEDRFQAMEEKRRDQARALELKKLVEAAVAGVESAGAGQQATLRKLEDLAALIALITRRLEKGEDRLQAMEEKQRDRILALERKLEEHAKQQHKAMEEHAKQQHKAMEEHAKQQHKAMKELAALVALITRRLEKGEDRLLAMEEKNRDRILALERKLEEQAKQQHKALEARIKEERMREELQAVKEKGLFLEYSAKIMAQLKQHQEQERLAKIQHQMEKLEAELKKVEKSMLAIVIGKRNSEADLSESSEDIPDNRALIIVHLPENAKLFVNNQLRKGASKHRFILTPPLGDGEHSFTLRVETERDGRVRSQTRVVTLRRGMHVRVSFER